MRLLKAQEIKMIAGAGEAQLLAAYWSARNAYNDIYFNGEGMVAANESRYVNIMESTALQLARAYPNSYILEPFSGDIHNGNANLLFMTMDGFAVVKK